MTASCSKKRLSLGKSGGSCRIRGNSDAFWTSTLQHRLGTAKLRRILDHNGTRTATHHITAATETTTGPPHSSAPAAPCPRGPWADGPRAPGRGAHMCGKKRMARRTSARGATFMAAIAAL